MCHSQRQRSKTVRISNFSPRLPTPKPYPERGAVIFFEKIFDFFHINYILRVYKTIEMKRIEYELEGFHYKGSNDLSWEESLQVLQQEESINFSIKVVKALEDKIEDHNRTSENKVTLKQLKKVYRRAAGNVFAEVPDPDEKRGLWAMARVNLYLRILKGDPFPTETNASMILDAKDEIDLVDFSLPTEEDFLQATKDMEKHDLNYKFSFEDLYLEEDGGELPFEFN
jgi:hypothetical protein